MQVPHQLNIVLSACWEESRGPDVNQGWQAFEPKQVHCSEPRRWMMIATAVIVKEGKEAICTLWTYPYAPQQVPKLNVLKLPWHGWSQSEAEPFEEGISIDVVRINVHHHLTPEMEQ